MRNHKNHSKVEKFRQGVLTIHVTAQSNDLQNWQQKARRIDGFLTQFKGLSQYKLVVDFSGEPVTVAESDKINVNDDALKFVESLFGVECIEFHQSAYESPIEMFFGEAAMEKIPGLVPQYNIRPYRVDFAVPDKRIAIEIDGHDYHSTPEQKAYDTRRQRAIQAAGWRVIRFTAAEVKANPAACVAEALRLIASMGGES